MKDFVTEFLEVHVNFKVVIPSQLINVAWILVTEVKKISLYYE